VTKDGVEELSQLGRRKEDDDLGFALVDELVVNDETKNVRDELRVVLEDGDVLIDSKDRLVGSFRDDIEEEGGGFEGSLSDLLDCGGDGGGEEEGLSRGRELGNDVGEVTLETHVQKGIGLVENELEIENAREGESVKDFGQKGTRERVWRREV